MIVTTIVVLLGCVITAGVILLARWVYLDAESRGINPWPWVLLVLLVSPNFIGLIVYALTRPKNMVFASCEHCRAEIPVNSNYCPNCGVQGRHDAGGPVKKHPGNRLLIAGFALIFSAFLTLIVVGFASFVDTSRLKSVFGSYSIVSINKQWGNSWSMSFYTFQGQKSKTFTADGAEPRFVYSSEITKGELTIELFDSSGGLAALLPVNESGEFIRLTPGEKYKVVVTANKASGKFEFEMQ